MITALILKGILIGCILSAPVGPVAVLAIRRALELGRAPGIATGLGATISDSFYSGLSLYFATAIMAFVVCWQALLYMIGGLVLIATAVITLGQKIDVKQGEAENNRPLMLFTRDGMLIALLNPANILGVSSTVIALSGLTKSSDVVWILSGIGCGSAIWWIGLGTLVAAFRNRIGNAFANRLNQLVALGLVCAAIYAFMQGAIGLLPITP